MFFYKRQQIGLEILGVTQFEMNRALSIPNSTGRRGLYKTVMQARRWFCRGRPSLGRAAFRSRNSRAVRVFRATCYSLPEKRKSCHAGAALDLYDEKDYGKSPRNCHSSVASATEE